MASKYAKTTTFHPRPRICKQPPIPLPPDAPIELLNAQLYWRQTRAGLLVCHVSTAVELRGYQQHGFQAYDAWTPQAATRLYLAIWGPIHPLELFYDYRAWQGNQLLGQFVGYFEHQPQPTYDLQAILRQTYPWDEIDAAIHVTL